MSHQETTALLEALTNLHAAVETRHAALEARIAALEGAVGAIPEPAADPFAVAFQSYREKARGVVRRQREKGLIE